MTSEPARESLSEIQLGVYATRKDVQKLAEGCARVLDRHPWPYCLSVAGQEQPTVPDGMPLAEFHDDLPEQWRIEHPGADPGSREIHEIRVGLPATRQQMDQLREELTGVACPDPLHDGPCPIPWSSGYAGPEDDGDECDAETVRYLEQRYGDLRRGV